MRDELKACLAVLIFYDNVVDRSISNKIQLHQTLMNSHATAFFNYFSMNFLSYGAEVEGCSIGFRLE